MVLYESVRLSLVTCFLITISCASSSGLGYDQVPECTPGLVYDPALDACIQKNSGIQNCGDNMAFQPTGSSGEGSCVCHYEVETSGWGPPQISSQTEPLCWNVGERGPCAKGYALVPIGRDMLRCRVDACANKGPRNAVGYSAWAEANANSESIFDFTYKGECYRTETKGLCGEYQVVRFVVPSKSPACTQRIERESGYSASSNVKLMCGDRLIEDRARSLCVPVADFE